MLISTSTSADLDATNVELHKLSLINVYAKFLTTGATTVVAVPQNFRRFRIGGHMWAGACAADETLAIDDSVHTIGADGVHLATSAAGGQYYTIQFIRTGASKTSGLGFFAQIIGLP